ncbi:MAG: GIY-YIG nuclease family protein [Acidobacteriota bacterium]|nr:GIY-YIG nuclease family protein [Acidobacteriota bacterium]
MELNDLFSKHGVAPERVLVLRHRPSEPKLNEVLPWLAEEHPELFNAYQQTQGEQLERAMLDADYVASFIAQGAGRALFIGLYSIGVSSRITPEEYWKIPAHIEMRTRWGMRGFTGEDQRTHILRFELNLKEEFYALWKGRLVISWPPPERSWWRRAHRNKMDVLAILEASQLMSKMPAWDELQFDFEILGILPSSWRAKLSEWRAIYYIFDESDRSGYVGSAYGENNLWQRWEYYAATGHGGNSLLKQRNPKNFRFSILERVSPDMPAEEVIRLEGKWKERLHTRFPLGLNDN